MTNIDGTAETAMATAEKDVVAAPIQGVTPASQSKPQRVPPKPRARKKPSPARSTRAKATTKAKGATRARVATPATQAKFPRHSVERALRIPKAIYDQNGGKPATPKEAAILAGGTAVTGAFNVEVSSAKKYGFLTGEGGKLVLTDRARKAIAPQSESDRLSALRDAILAAPDFSTVYNYYRGENLPDDNFLVNALTDRFKIPTDKLDEFLPIFLESIRSAELLDESAERPRLIDVGRDDSHRPSSSNPGKPGRVSVVAGSTCFVVQPFAAPFGPYYESVFKPAIEQAGLTAVRADAEIFGTGKVIDQIWRGINQADVLVAELTTKNPNVFYELGLAHALHKPVILISSNQDDVPFDLRHIRVILYDQADPFWGQKLIDKVADNIRSAIADPEDAIFKVEQVLA
jgi:hypothetical protein